MFKKLKIFFRHKNCLDKYDKQIKDANNLICKYEQKYKMSSEDFISKRYSNVCIDVEAADAHNWATLYITIGKMTNG